MKKLAFVVTFACLAGMPAAVLAQGASWRKTDDGYWDRKNVLRVGISVTSSSGLGTGFLPVTIAYDRNVGRNVTVGGVIHLSDNFFSLTMDGYEVDDTSVFAGARVGYDLKVSRNLRLRFGLGAGAGYHYIHDIRVGDGGTLPKDFPTDKWLVHMLVDVHWAWRVWRNMELSFAPLVLSPSQFVFHPWDDDHFSGGYYGYNFGSIGLSTRF